MYAKVSKKGQVTIPMRVREKLNIKDKGSVLFLFEGDEVKLKGIPGRHPDLLAGSLKRYAPKYVPLNRIREEIKKERAGEAAGEGLSD